MEEPPLFIQSALRFSDCQDFAKFVFIYSIFIFLACVLKQI